MWKSVRPSTVLVAPFVPFLAAAFVARVARRSGQGCAPAAKTRRGERPTKDALDTAAETGSFETFVEAVQAAGLAETLKGKGPFTIFAPTDAAFGRLREGALDELLEDTERLVTVLTNHVVPGRFESSTLEGIAAVRSVQGGSLEVDTSMGVKIGTAYVVRPDIEATNGVIHAVDSVLLPE